MKRGIYATTALAVLLGSMAVTASAQEPAAAAASGAEAAADAWAAATEARMTDDERFTLLHGFMPIPIGPYADPELQANWPDDGVPGAGHVAGGARLGGPAVRNRGG